MFKKIWNHAYTVGDTFIMAVVCSAIFAVILGAVTINEKRKCKKLDDSIDRSMGYYDDDCEED